MDKKNLAIVFGGKSSEYEISLLSASYIISICRKLPEYHVELLGISRQGEWFHYLGDEQAIAQDAWQEADISPVRWEFNPDRKGFMSRDKFFPVDVFFPVLHGKNGEDGSIQGFFEMLGVPYVGCQVLDSAAAMDKVISRILFDHLGIKQSKWTWLRKQRYLDKGQAALDEIVAEIGYPFFVKPANAGSSIGISKVHGPDEFEPALDKAFEHDVKVVIDQAVDAREVEVAVLEQEDSEIMVSLPGEIIPEHEFYDYVAKYQDDRSKLIVPTQLPGDIYDQIVEYAKRAFRAVDGHGLCRADFLVDKMSGEVYLNEINTLPGFTSISMYPKLMEISGISAVDLMRKLLTAAFNSHAEEA